MFEEPSNRIEKMEVLNRAQTHSLRPHSNHNISKSSSSNHGNSFKPVKLELPKFSWVRVKKRIFIAQQFFNDCSVQEDERITITSFAMEGDASE